LGFGAWDLEFQNSMAAKKPFLKITCSVCKKVNYYTKRSKKMGEKKLEMKKFCSSCKAHTAHKESKR
jgi:large subunit ribosomal protein L33